MIRNEKGFTYPLTFCIILLASVVLSIQLEMYLSEKRLMSESENLLKKEYYFLSSLKWTEKLFQEIDEEQLTGVYTFKDGEVHYSTFSVTESLLRVTFVLKLGDLPEQTGIGYYDKEFGKMIRWNEK